jgi:NADH-quinone oxidoreductase subunit G
MTDLIARPRRLRKSPALREIESYDAVLVLGEDLTQTGARAALAVRQAVKGKAREMAAAQKVADWQIAAILNIGQRAKHPLFVTNVDNTRLDDIAAWTYCAPVEDQARLGFAIAHALDNNSPAVELDRDLQNKVDVIVQALAGAKKPLIISGTNAGSAEIVQAAANVASCLIISPPSKRRANGRPYSPWSAAGASGAAAGDCSVASLMLRRIRP